MMPYVDVDVVKASSVSALEIEGISWMVRSADSVWCCYC